MKGVFNFLYLSPTEWDLESLLFQATMPGLDEEIAFRGIMLGLLTKILKPARRPLFHPAIYVTALLCGSILLALVSHNLGNVASQVISMGK